VLKKQGYLRIFFPEKVVFSLAGNRKHLHLVARSQCDDF